MQETLCLRPAQTQELPIVAQFWLQMFEEVGKHREADFAADWRERFVEYFSRRIAEDEVCYSLALDGERIVGTAGAMLADGYPSAVHGIRTGYIFGVFVLPEYRGRGLATQLTESSIAFLRTRGIRRIRLHASPFGRPIYERLDFVPTNEMELTAPVVQR
jgi:ribosomal protein S18 acetylase RimI-like enzyme